MTLTTAAGATARAARSGDIQERWAGVSMTDGRTQLTRIALRPQLLRRAARWPAPSRPLGEQVPSLPWKRAAQPEEIARLAVFLASADAHYVTGSSYVMDGGLMINVGQGAQP
jgi:NAD(P)-dependent dehydrogenase (short-subunit alcohol dehydrogenase family)